MRKSNETLSRTLIYIALIVLAVAILLPLIWVFLASLKSNQQFYGSPWSLPDGLHFENYVNAWNKAEMGSLIFHSVQVTATALLILLLVALPAAYVLARFRFKGRAAINIAFMAGLFINVNYIVLPIFLMLKNGDEFLNRSLSVRFFLNNFFVLAVVYAATALPFTIYLLRSYFASLPRDFEEAAYVDGASRLRSMIKIMFPMAKPAIVTIILFNFLAFWNEYIIAMTLIVNPKLPKTLPVGLLNLFSADKASSEYGRMYAGMVIIMLPTLILYMIVQKRLTEGMTVGGVKG